MGVFDKTRIMYDFNEDFFSGLVMEYNALKYEVKTNLIRLKINNQLQSSAQKAGMKIPVYICRYYTKYVDVKGRPLRKSNGSYRRKQLTFDTARTILKEALCNYIDVMEGKPFEQIVIQDEQIEVSASVNKLLSRKAISSKDFTYQNVFSHQYWANKIGGLGKHKYSKPFKCYCCGGIISEKQGWRIEPTDYCFCADCMKGIEKLCVIKESPNKNNQTREPRDNKEKKPYLGEIDYSRQPRAKILYTPMGNKR